MARSRSKVSSSPPSPFPLPPPEPAPLPASPPVPSAPSPSPSSAPAITGNRRAPARHIGTPPTMTWLMDTWSSAAKGTWPSVGSVCTASLLATAQGTKKDPTQAQSPSGVQSWSLCCWGDLSASQRLWELRGYKGAAASFAVQNDTDRSRRHAVTLGSHLLADLDGVQLGEVQGPDPGVASSVVIVAASRSAPNVGALERAEPRVSVSWIAADLALLAEGAQVAGVGVELPRLVSRVIRPSDKGLSTSLADDLPDACHCQKSTPPVSGARLAQQAAKPPRIRHRSWRARCLPTPDGASCGGSFGAPPRRQQHSP
jgi:hypothetical protein